MNLVGDVFGCEGHPLLSPDIRQANRDQKPFIRPTRRDVGDVGLAEIKRGGLNQHMSTHRERAPDEGGAG